MKRRWLVVHISLSIILLFSLVSPVQSEINKYEYLTLEPSLHHTFILETGTDDRLYIGFEISDGDAIIFYLLKESDYASYSGGYASSFFYGNNVTKSYSEVIPIDVEDTYYLVLFNPLSISRSFNIHIVAGEYPAITPEASAFVTIYLPIILGLLVLYGIILLIFRRRDKKMEREVIHSYSEKRKTTQKQPSLQSKEKQREIAKRIKKEQLVARDAEEKRLADIKKSEQMSTDPSVEIDGVREIIEVPVIPSEATLVVSRKDRAVRILPMSSYRKSTRGYKILMAIGFVLSVVIVGIMSIYVQESLIPYWVTATVGLVGGTIVMLTRYNKFKKRVWTEIQLQTERQYK